MMPTLPGPRTTRPPTDRPFSCPRRGPPDQRGRGVLGPQDHPGPGSARPRLGRPHPAAPAPLRAPLLPAGPDGRRPGVSPVARPGVSPVAQRAEPSGVHALSELTGDVEDGPEGPVVPLRLTLLQEPVPRADLLADPRMREAEVLRMPAGSNPS